MLKVLFSSSRTRIVPSNDLNRYINICSLNEAEKVALEPISGTWVFAAKTFVLCSVGKRGPTVLIQPKRILTFLLVTVLICGCSQVDLFPQMLKQNHFPFTSS